MGFEKAYGGNKPSRGRNKNDHYATPPIGTWALLRNHHLYGLRVHEPAAGRGWMARELRRYGLEVVAHDLVRYENMLTEVEPHRDFLQCDRRYGDACVTNPPFKDDLAEAFIRKALELEYQVVAMFCRMMFREGTGRYKLFVEYPPTDVYNISGRVNFQESKFNTLSGQMGGMIPFSWFVWDKRRSWHGRETHEHWVLLTDVAEWIEEAGVWEPDRGSLASVLDKEDMKGALT